MKKVSILSLSLKDGGVEKAIASLANMLKDDFEVEIATTYKFDKNDEFIVDDKVKVTYLTDVLPNKKEFKNALKEKNIIKIIKEGFNALKVLYLRRKTMINYIKNTDSDYIISTRLLFNKYLNQIKKDCIKIAWEHNHHFDNKKYINNLVNSVNKMDYFILVSNELKEYYENLLDKTKCVYIPNFIDELPNTKANLDTKNLISIGRLEDVKGFDELINIFREFNKVDDSYILNIIGDGSKYDELKNLIISYNLEDKIILHGRQNKDYINKILMDSSLYLMTSHTESFGIVLIEAMSYGLPCIAYKFDKGNNEIIKDGYNGYIIDKKNIDEYVKCMKMILDDDVKRSNLGNNAYKTVMNFLPSNVYKKWKDIIK